jgi:hypothetical protein
MKAVFITGIAAIICMASCTKKKTNDEIIREAEQKLIGNWAMQKRTTEVFTPITPYVTPGTGALTEYVGSARDHFNFDQTHSVTIDTAAVVSSKSFELINPYHVFIGDDYWWIDQLTTNQLVLMQDRNDGAQNTRTVIKIFLKK